MEEEKTQKQGAGAKIKGFVLSVLGVVKRFFVDNWKKPAEGNYVSSREVVCYSVGGMGVQFIAAMASTVPLNASCLLLGTIYGITPNEFAYIGIIQALVLLVFQPLKAWLIDNTPGGRGKARPWLLWLSVPSAVLLSSLAFMDPSWDHMTMVIVVAAIYVVMNWTYQFYYSQYTLLAYVISPNSQERANIITISSIVYSLAPTITSAIIPLIGEAFPLGQRDPDLYKVIIPVFCALGVLFTLLTYFGTKERVIQPREYKAKVKFWDAMKKCVKNKYLWIINITTWFQFGRIAVTGMITWVYVYILQNAGIQSLVTLVMGTASGIGMFVAPFVIKAIGKRNAAIISNFVAAGASVLLIAFPDNLPLLFISCYLVMFGIAVQIITQPAMNADALDWQQYKTGDRYEGVSGNLGMIGQAIAMGTGLVIPAIQEAYGIGVGGDYEMLYDAAVRAPMFRTLAILAAVCSAACAIPFFFWDLSEKKHSAIIEELKLRAEAQNIADGHAGESVLSSGEALSEEETERLEEEAMQQLEAEAAPVEGAIEKQELLEAETLGADGAEEPAADNAEKEGAEDTALTDTEKDGEEKK